MTNILVFCKKTCVAGRRVYSPKAVKGLILSFSFATFLFLYFQTGCVSKFKLDVKNIVGTVAKDAENKGHFEDAAMLYDLADVCLMLLKRLLKGSD